MSKNKSLKGNWLPVTCLAVWMGVIFYLSAQDGTQSSGASTGLLAFFLRVLGKDPSCLPENTLSMLHGFLRTAAHAGEYCVLGALAFWTAARLWPNARLGCWVAWGFCVLWAVSDEFHQLFVPGRACDWRDLAVDSLGALAGVTAAILASRLRIRLRVKRAIAKDNKPIGETNRYSA